MKVSDCWLWRQIAAGLVILLMAPFGEAAVAQQTNQPVQTTQPTQQSQDTSGSTQPPAQTPVPQSTPAATGTSSSPGLPAAPQAASTNQQAGSSPVDQQQNAQPVGTAAAPYENPVGVAVSRPAGAAIAPAKQRRSRSFFIKVGLLVGAAVAVGTVVALSKGSPSRAGH